jgi:cell division protein FtsN
MLYKLMIGFIAASSILLVPATAQDGSGQLSYTSGRGVYVIPAVLVKRTLDAVFAIPVPSDELRSSRHERLYRYRVRVGTFAVKENATRLKGKLDLEGYSADIRPWTSRTKGQLYTVSVGDYGTAADATRSLNEIRKIFNINDLSVASTK